MFIINPIDYSKISLYSNKGKYILKNYISYYKQKFQIGGKKNYNYQVIVLCPKQSSRWKYWGELVKHKPIKREYGYWTWNNDNVNKAIVGNSITKAPLKRDIIDKYRFRYNAGLNVRNVTMAIFEGFINILNIIIKKKLKNVLITEDDAIIDWDRLENFTKPDNIKKLPNTLIYIGGELHYPLLRDLKKKCKINFKKGINKINDGIDNQTNRQYRITGSWGQFIKDENVAKTILQNLVKLDRNNKEKYLSVQYDFALSKMKIDKYCLYPPIVSVRTNKPSLNVWNNLSLESFKFY